VFGVRVRRHVDVDAPALGAAILAGAGTGVYSDTTQGVEFCVHPDEELDPDGDLVDIYSKKFARYRRLYPAIQELLG